MDDKGQPIIGEDGQPMPGRARAIAMGDPTANALVQNLLKHDEFEGQQQDNVEIGRKGVKQLQPTE